MNQDTQKKIFVGIVFFLFVTNLFVSNGSVEFWTPEKETIASVLDFEENTALVQPTNLPSLITAQLSHISQERFFLRLPGILILILTFFGIYNLGKKIFGETTISYTLLVLGSSFLTLNFAKFATSDIWLFSSLTFIAFSIILYLKQPIKKWSRIGIASVSIGALTNPIATFIFTLLMGGLLFFIHPNGKRLKGLAIWFSPFLLSLILFFTDIFSFQSSYVEILGLTAVRFHIYLIIILLGILPWIAFLPSALWNMFKRLRQGEELALISFSWVFASIFSFSLASQAIFSLIIAKQIKDYSDKNYPYENAVKSTALLHLGLILFGAIYLIIISWENLKGVGFRAAMVTTLFYWMGCLLAFIGLYGKNNKIIIGGLSLAGLLATYFFWVKAFPILYQAMYYTN
jgi:4-amino-4-deoxy-L-arabinose transferase-like glycosyltransferase